VAEQHGLDYRDRKAVFDFGVLRQIGDAATTQTDGLDQTVSRPQQTGHSLISVLFPAPLGPTIAVSEPLENSPLR
jgi:hypothetical protein